MCALRPALALLALMALASTGLAQVTEESLPPASASPTEAAAQVDPEREAAAVTEIDAYVSLRKGAPPKEQEAAIAHFTEYQNGLLELEQKHHGTWAAWQALMTAGQIESRIFGQPLEGIRYYRKVWAGVRHRTDSPPKGIFLNVPRVGLRFAEALMREDLLNEAEVVLREASRTELPEGERIRQRLKELPERRRLLPGKPAPAFEATDFAGQPHSLADYRGQALLLHFWSGINGPSLSTMPEIVELVKENAGRDFRILSVNVDPHVTREDHERMKAAGQTFLPRLFDADGLRKMLTRHQLTCPVIWDGLGLESPLAKSYSIKNLPGIYLIGPDGLIRARSKHGDRLRAAVAQVLAE